VANDRSDEDTIQWYFRQSVGHQLDALQQGQVPIDQDEISASYTAKASTWTCQGLVAYPDGQLLGQRFELLQHHRVFQNRASSTCSYTYRRTFR